MSTDKPFSHVTYKNVNVTSPKKKGFMKNNKIEEALSTLFKDSKNTVDEATRMRVLRDRSFTGVSSIFTNPLKPVMPLHGPPLESIIKTGPGMPGVSIAMMTPTEMLQLQREVHSLRSQLLDRTRECPYADCDRYFTFSDGEGLDQHIREDHNVLRCFLCDKNQHLLPYYDVGQIKEHFVEEHVDDVLTAFGSLQIKGPPAAPTAAQPGRPEQKCELFHICGVVTTHMTTKQLREHMKHHVPSPVTSDGYASEDVSEESPLGSVFDPDDMEEEETEKKLKSPQPPTRRPWEGVLGREYNETTTPTPTPTQQAIPIGRPQKANATKPAQKSVPLSTTTPATKSARKARAADSSSLSSSDAGMDMDMDESRRKRKRRRRRIANVDTTYVRNALSGGEEDYEYSERSAVTDPVAELEPVPPAHKKQRGANAPPPTPVAPTRGAYALSPMPATVESVGSAAEDSDA